VARAASTKKAKRRANSGGVDSGAQVGIVHTVPAGAPSPHAARTIKWKTADETADLVRLKKQSAI
jgi:hypothetical protein